MRSYKEQLRALANSLYDNDRFSNTSSHSTISFGSLDEWLIVLLFFLAFRSTSDVARDFLIAGGSSSRLFTSPSEGSSTYFFVTDVEVEQLDVWLFVRLRFLQRPLFGVVIALFLDSPFDFFGVISPSRSFCGVRDRKFIELGDCNVSSFCFR